MPRAGGHARCPSQSRGSPQTSTHRCATGCPSREPPRERALLSAPSHRRTSLVPLQISSGCFPRAGTRDMPDFAPRTRRATCSYPHPVPRSMENGTHSERAERSVMPVLHTRWKRPTFLNLKRGKKKTVVVLAKTRSGDLVRVLPH